MVKKLFKYEAKYYLRLLIPFGISVVATALFVRILSEFRMDNVVFDIVYGSAEFLFAVSVIACFGAVFGLCIKRFYSNLYGPEGYLSFTLPVTASQHILAKLLAAFVFFVSAAVISFAGFLITTVGEVFVELVKAASYLFELGFKDSGYNFVFLLIEAVLLILSMLVFNILLFYTCISLGQTAKKKRVFMSFVWYFVYYGITQVIGTVFVSTVASISEKGKWADIVVFIRNNIDWLMHAVPCAAIVITCVLSLVFFLANRSIITKKLNLE